MLVSLCKMTNTSVQKISKNALVQNVAFVISFWKVKEYMLVEKHSMRDALCVLVAGTVYSIEG